MEDNEKTEGENNNKEKTENIDQEKEGNDKQEEEKEKEQSITEKTDENSNEIKLEEKKVVIEKDDEVFLAPEDNNNDNKKEINFKNLLTHAPKTEIEILDNIIGDNYDINFKIIVIGNSGVGKSCITLKATQDIFKEDISSTIGFQFFSFHVKIDEKIFKLQIWDTCGQEVYKSLISNFYRNSSLALILYAINNRDSFQHAETWLNDLKNQANPNVRVFLVGNKSDLEKERTVNKEIIDELIYKYNIDYYIETSAKDGNKVIDLFKTIALFLYDDYINFKENNYLENERKSYYLDRDTITSKKEKNCFCF